MKNKKKIYLDKQGYEDILAEIEALKEKLHQINLGRKEAFSAGAGDGWDTPEFEEIERQEMLVLGEIKHKTDMLSNAVIIDKHNDEDLIDIGDIIEAKMIYSKEDKEDLTFKLVGSVGNMSADIQEVSINSPLGASVYKKTIGDECSYSVNDNTFNLIINNKYSHTMNK